MRAVCADRYKEEQGPEIVAILVTTVLAHHETEEQAAFEQYLVMRNHRNKSSNWKPGITVGAVR